MAQLLPGSPPQLIRFIRKRIIQRQKLLTDFISPLPLMDLPGLMFDDIETVGCSPLQHFCGCSKESLLPMLFSLDIDELRQACKAGDPIEMV
ncbi:hypothetical protein BBD40_13845 [Paenibacillus ihbetae]|uniref:Uncharacterized protein n=1 Tax=Paenibacillus ihbetae TaxID=1870820 RepID=A0ABX3K079_9BACL|nr:hypothetical protein BBD40_13845 [Paenibacillus ihbetae]